MAVTLSPLAGAGWQFFDNDGIPLSGGLLYTYAAGTSTPLATYTSVTGSIQNANPIVLDSAGRVPNEIWITYGFGYKFVLQNSSFVQIGTWDNIPTNAPPPLLNDASSIAYEQGYTVTAGSFVVGKTYLITSVGTTNFVAIGAASNTVGTYFVATGAGSGTGTAELSRTVQNKLQEIFSVKDFGAIGDGSADDTSAIQAAIAAAIAAVKITTISGLGGATFYAGSGPTVFFPSGIYKISSYLTANAQQSVNYLNFVGENSTIIPTSATTVVTTTAGFSSGSTTITVADSTNINVGSVISGTGIVAGTQVTAMNFNVLTISIATTASSSGNYTFTSGITIFGGVGYDVRFSNLIFKGGACAISLKTSDVDSSRLDIIDCEFWNQTVASVMSDLRSPSTNINIGRNKFMQIDNTLPLGYSLYMLSGDNTQVFDCWFSSYTPVPIYNAVNKMSVRDCIFVPQGSITRWCDNYGVSIEFTGCRFGGEDGGHTVVNNYTSVGLPDGTGYVSTTRVAIINCMIISNSPAYIIAFYAVPTKVEVYGNWSISNTNEGFYFDAGITTTNYLNWQQYGFVNVSNNAQAARLLTAFANADGILGSLIFNSLLIRDNYIAPTYRERLTANGLYGSIGVGDGTWNTTSLPDATLTYGVDQYNIATAIWTATANSEYVNNLAKTNALNYANLTGGQAYTLMLNVAVAAADVVEIVINVGGMQKISTLGTGIHIICVPFVYLNTTGLANINYDIIQIGTLLPHNYDQVQLSRLTLVKGLGQYMKEVLITETPSSSPSSMTVGLNNSSGQLGYQLGDVNWRSTPISGGPPGDICTSAGNPGTWKAMANLA